MITSGKLLAVILLLLLAGNAYALRDSVLAERYNEGVALYNKKDYRKSSRQFKKVIKEDDSDYRALNNLGASYIKENKFNQAVIKLKAALELKRDVDVLYNLAYAAYRRGTYEESERYLREVIELNGKSYKDTALIGGLVYYHLDRYEIAIGYMRRYMERESMSYEALFTIGASYLELGKLYEAGLNFETCIELRPGDAQAHYNLALVRIGNGEYNQSIDSLKRALKIDNDFADCYYNLAVANMKLDEYDNSVVFFKKYLEMNPAAPDKKDVRAYIRTLSSL